MQVAALLLGALHNGGNPLLLQTGSSVIFHVDSTEGIQRMATSAITGLTHIRGGGQTKPGWPVPDDMRLRSGLITFPQNR
jgi:hypothetical protein